MPRKAKSERCLEMDRRKDVAELQARHDQELERLERRLRAEGESRMREMIRHFEHVQTMRDERWARTGKRRDWQQPWERKDFERKWFGVQTSTGKADKADDTRSERTRRVRVQFSPTERRAPMGGIGRPKARTRGLTNATTQGSALVAAGGTGVLDTDFHGMPNGVRLQSIRYGGGGDDHNDHDFRRGHADSEGSEEGEQRTTEAADGECDDVTQYYGECVVESRNGDANSDDDSEGNDHDLHDNQTVDVEGQDCNSEDVNSNSNDDSEEGEAGHEQSGEPESFQDESYVEEVVNDTVSQHDNYSVEPSADTVYDMHYDHHSYYEDDGTVEGYHGGGDTEEFGYGETDGEVDGYSNDSVQDADSIYDEDDDGYYS